MTPETWAIAEDVHRRIMRIKAERREPREIRLGWEERRTIYTDPEIRYGCAFSLDLSERLGPDRLFGVPIKWVGLPTYADVLP